MNDRVVYSSLVAACSQDKIMALPTKLGPLKASFAVDTGASVNVLSNETYLALKHARRVEADAVFILIT